MPRLLQIISQGETLMERSEDIIINNVRASEKEIYKELLKLFDKLDVSSGKIQKSDKAIQFINSMDEKILQALKKTGYPDAIKKFIKSFDQIQANIIDVHEELNNVNITNSQIDPFKKLEIANTVSKLTDAGLAKDFINPIREALYRNITTGATISDTEKMLRDFILTSGNKDGKLLRYVKQVSRDSISQFDGTIQANIANELGLNAKRYVGSLIKDSRGQCAKWVTENSGIIMLEDLQEEIDWAFGKHIYNGRATSGMIPGTNVSTFDIYRGGYGCRHRSIPTYRRKGDSGIFV